MLTLGTKGETIAAEYLTKKGYTVVVRNFRTSFGEIDLICRKDKTLVFVEVKTRRNTNKGQPYEAITPLKLRHLKKAIYYYLTQNGGYDVPMRLDVISILFGTDGLPVIKHFSNVELE